MDFSGNVFTKKCERKIPYKCLIKLDVELENGSKMTVMYYASAGKLWTEESKMAVWMLTE